MFNFFNNKKSITKKNKPIFEEQALLKESTRLYNQGDVNGAINNIDKVINSYINKNQKENAWAAYKKKSSYLYKNGRGDESWTILNKLSLDFGRDFILICDIEDQKRKQLEFEKQNPLDIADAIVRVKIFKDRSKLLQNLEYKDDNFVIDYEWEDEDKKLSKLLKNNTVKWTDIKPSLVNAYTNLKNIKTSKGIILETQNIYSSFRNLIRNH